jgi:hypothetical protein
MPRRTSSSVSSPPGPPAEVAGQLVGELSDDLAAQAYAYPPNMPAE